MGIHDRDYYRENSGGLLQAWGRWGVTNWLIAITTLIFLAQALSRDASRAASFADSPVAQFAIYDPAKILQGEVWRLVTPIFLHADLWHLAFNMLVLWWAGSRVEELYGKSEFTIFYLASGIFANVLTLSLQAAGIVPVTLALGASGAVTAVIVLYACHAPFQQVSLFFVITVPLWFLVVFYIAMDLLGALGLGQRGIGYVAHLGGALFGYVYYRTGFRFHALIPSLPSRSRNRARPTLRIVRPDPDDLDEGDRVPAAVESVPRSADNSDETFESKVDRVLDKVSKHGQESLTPEEREILFRASEVYKKRRR